MADSLATPRLGDLPRALRIGYVPLTDAAPLVVADALGLFAAAGVRVTLTRESVWAAVRDKLAFGTLDAAHPLGPLAIARAAGAGGLRRTLIVTAGLARNGNTITLSHALAARLSPMAPPLDAARLAAALQARAEDGLPPPTFAIDFPYSSHNYLLRHWLAAGGIDPDNDIGLVVVPPPPMARALAEGAIEGFCAGEPWGSHAEASGVGRVALSTGAIWPDHPEKVLAFSEGARERDEAAVLPALAWGEKGGTVTNSERVISRQRGFFPRPGEARPDWWIIAQVAAHLGHGSAFAWDDSAAIFREHAAMTALARPAPPPPRPMPPTRCAR